MIFFYIDVLYLKKLLIMSYFDLKKEKAVNALLYVSEQLEKPDTHKVFKILYFADKKHLYRYGRPISGDTYFKMEYGPVPSFIRDVVEEKIKGLEEVIAKYHKHFLKNLRQAKLDHLSETDMNCLNESISENRDLSFQELTFKSHDEAYHKAEWQIDYLDIAKAEGDDHERINYISEQILNERIAFE